MLPARRLLVRARDRMSAGPPLARRLAALVAYRGHARRRPLAAVRYLLDGRGEVDNFTYEIENACEIPRFLAEAFGVPAAGVERHLGEIEGDRELRQDLERQLARRPGRKPSARYGRRVAWYATVRILRPRLVVESGVHDGIGSALLLRALERNGDGGRLVGIDVDPGAGWLIPGWLRPSFELRLGRSLEVLATLGDGEAPDLFIHDSDHRYEYELAEYRALAAHLRERTVLLSDSDNPGGPLELVAGESGRAYHYWKERSRGHFYPGDGVGLAVPG